MHIKNWIILIIINLFLQCSTTYEHNGIKFSSKNAYDNYILNEKLNNEKKSKELVKMKQESEAFDFLQNKCGNTKILNLNKKEDSEIFLTSIFNENDNKSDNKISIDNQFEYEKNKQDYKNTRNSKCILINPESTSISEYDFKKEKFDIVWANLGLDFPKISLNFRIINMAGTSLVNSSITVGSEMDYINKLPINISKNDAEYFLDDFKNGKIDIFLLLELNSLKDENSGIKCNNLKKSLFNNQGNQNEIDRYVRPTCIEENWEKLKTRNLNFKFKGYYIIDGSKIIKY
jgi:hypothetical protein